MAASMTGKSMSAVDEMTILTVMPGCHASKRFVMSGSKIEKHSFDAGRLFAAGPVGPLSGIQELSVALKMLEGQPKVFVIRGEPIGAALTKDRVPRRSAGPAPTFQTPGRGRYWIMIDIDKIIVAGGLAPGAKVKRIQHIADQLVHLLPPEFHDVSYHWQLSSSAGMGDQTAVSMHLWFWLSAPVPDEVLKAWGKAVNHQHGRTVIDTALFQAVQPHYTAAPEFVGLPDPFPVRSGLCLKKSHSVQLDLSLLNVSTPKTNRAVATGAVAACQVPARSGSGLEYHLSCIGDHPGGDGFYAPLRAAAASYVAEHGAVGTDKEALYQRLRGAVLNAYADPIRHTKADVEGRASREQIMPLIDSALTKFGDQPRHRRKARVIDGVAPHFEATHVSVDEAIAVLQAFVTRPR